MRRYAAMEKKIQKCAKSLSSKDGNEETSQTQALKPKRSPIEIASIKYKTMRNNHDMGSIVRKITKQEREQATIAEKARAKMYGRASYSPTRRNVMQTNIEVEK